MTETHKVSIPKEIMFVEYIQKLNGLVFYELHVLRRMVFYVVRPTLKECKDLRDLWLSENK